MEIHGDLTISDLEKAGLFNKYVAGFIERLKVETYDDFISRLYKDIDEIIIDIQSGARYLQNPDNKKEDRITMEIVRLLRRSGYDASHDTDHRGHSDLHVKSGLTGEDFIWLGEAKIHNSYDYLWEGFNQLTTRYSTGDFNQAEGGMLIYIFRKNTASVMSKWKEHLQTKYPEDLQIEDCQRRSLSFYSSLCHEASGLPFRVRHMPLILYFNPQD